MKKVLLLLMAIIVGTGFLSAQDPLYTVLFGSQYNSGEITSYTATWTVKISNATDKTVTIANFNNNKNGWSYIKCGRKNNASVATITTTAAVSEPLEKVVLTIDALTVSKVNSIKLLTSTTNNFTNPLETVDCTPAKGDITFNITKQEANLYYQLKFDCASGTSNGLVQVSKIQYFAGEVGPAKTPSEITFPEATYTAYLGKEFDAPTATKVAGDGAITYASENEAVATVNAETGAVTLVAGGSTKITATIAATETYAKATASYTLTVVDLNNTAVFNSPMGEEFTFDGQTETYPWTHDNQYGLKGTGYINGKNTACDAYAVSPMIDLTMVAEAKLTFDEAFNMYKTITVDKVSEYATIEVKEEGKDWLPLAKPTSPASFSWTFFANDPVDLSAYKGKKIQIGFRYVSTTSVAGTWEIKNIKVEGKFTVPVPVCQNWRDNLQPGDEIVWTVPEIEGLELHVRTMQNIFETTDALAAQAAEEIPEGWTIDGYTATYTVPESLQSLPGYQVYATYNGVLEGEASNLSIGANGNTSGVENLEVVEEAEVEFFNLQGVRVEGELTPGLYIRRQGNQATKVIVK